MRRLVFVGLLVTTALISAPAARASDDSVRAVVQAQATRQIKEDKKFEKAVRKLSTKAQLKKARTATKKQRASIETFKKALAAERADSAKVKKGRREMLDAHQPLRPRPQQVPHRADAGHQRRRALRARPRPSRP